MKMFYDCTLGNFTIDIIVTLLLFLCLPLLSQEKTLPQEELKRVQNNLENALRKAHYMEEDCESTVYPDWENFPLTTCTYSVKDNDGTIKSAVVIMFNPSPEQLARWIVYTCIEVKGSADKFHTDKLCNHILKESGVQFPIAGIVLEDIIPADGIYESYCFRNEMMIAWANRICKCI